LSFSSNLPEWTHTLDRRFRSSLAELVGVVPLSTASVSVLLQQEGPLQTVSTCSFEETETPPSVEFTIGEAALQWLQRHRRELVLEVRPEHGRSEFYGPFIEHGIQSALVVPVFRSGVLVGAVTVGSAKQKAYTAGHLKLITLMCRELAPHFGEPEPMPARIPPQVSADAQAGQQPLTQSDTSAVGTVANSSEEACIEVDSLGRVARWDDVAESIFGWSAREVAGDFLTLFYRPKHLHLLDVSRMEDLLASGAFRTRAVCYDRKGVPVVCEVELSELETSGGFQGRFRRVASRTLLPREPVQFGLARLFDFSDSVVREDALPRPISPAPAGP